MDDDSNDNDDNDDNANSNDNDIAEKKQQQSQKNQASIATVQENDTQRQESINDENDNEYDDIAMPIASLNDYGSNTISVVMTPTPQSERGASVPLSSKSQFNNPILFKMGTRNTISPSDLKRLLKNEPLALFKRYDLQENGTLTKKQFGEMVTDMYSDNNSGDVLFQNKITETFLKIDRLSDNNNSLYYQENVHNLEIVTKMSNTPDKDQFLELCIQIFGNKNDDMKEELPTDPLECVQKIMADFVQNINNTNSRYQTAKKTAERLFDWVEKYGIPAFKQKTDLTKRSNSLQHEKTLMEEELKIVRQELSIKDETISKFSDHIKKIENTEKNKNNQFQELKQKYKTLCQTYSSVQTEYDTLIKKQNEYEEYKKNDEQTRYYIEEIKSLKSQNQSFKNQVVELQDQLQLQRQNEISVNTQPLLTSQKSISHANAIQGPNSGSEDNFSFDDDDDIDDVLPAFIANNSVRKIPSLNLSPRRTN
eukprot:194202_1